MGVGVSVGMGRRCVHMRDVVGACVCAHICEGGEGYMVEHMLEWMLTPVHHPCSQVMELRETCTCWLGPGCLWPTL